MTPEKMTRWILDVVDALGLTKDELETWPGYVRLLRSPGGVRSAFIKAIYLHFGATEPDKPGWFLPEAGLSGHAKNHLLDFPQITANSVRTYGRDWLLRFHGLGGTSADQIIRYFETGTAFERPGAREVRILEEQLRRTLRGLARNKAAIAASIKRAEELRERLATAKAAVR